MTVQGHVRSATRPPGREQQIQASLSISPSKAQAYRGVARWLALTAGVVALASLIGGWMLGISRLQQVFADFSHMAPSTALFILLLSTAIYLLSGAHFHLRALPFTLAMIAVAVAGVQLGLYTFFGLNIEFVLYGVPDPAGIGTMSPATAFCLVLVGTCILLDLMAGHRAEHAYAGLAALGLFVSALDLIAYSFDVQALYAIEIFRAMALHTALCFALLFMALLCRRPTWSWTAIATGPLNGSSTFRRILLPAILTPWLFCWLALQASEHALLTPNFRLILVASACILVLLVVLLANGQKQNQSAAMRSRALLELQTAVTQRDLLLREVYHRVKNNLQLVEALLALQSRKIDSVQARDAIRTTRQRIHTLGMVHQKILEGQDYSSIDLKAFLDDVVKSLAAGFGASERQIDVTFTGQSTYCSIEEAIPLGLLTNELISNVFKHAFTGRDRGTVTVELTPEGEELKLVVADDGVGRAAPPDTGHVSLGSDIISALVAQLDGTLRETTDNGTRIEVTIAQPAGA